MEKGQPSWASVNRRWDEGEMNNQEALDFLLNWASDKELKLLIPLITRFAGIQRTNEKLVKQLEVLERQIRRLKDLFKIGGK